MGEYSARAVERAMKIQEVIFMVFGDFLPGASPGGLRDCLKRPAVEGFYRGILDCSPRDLCLPRYKVCFQGLTWIWAINIAIRRDICPIPRQIPPFSTSSTTC
jgi:hypothetical protein